MSGQEKAVYSQVENWSRVMVLIDRAALRHNVAQVRRMSGNSRLCAVVKADAYGHGVHIVVPALMPCVDSFAVATIEEGVTVRKWTQDHDIVVLSEFNHPAQLSLFNTHRLQPVIHQPEQLSWLRDHGGATAGCWLKVDTGMHRLGFSQDQLGHAYQTIVDCGAQKPGIMSHFATADEPNHPKNRIQLGRFHEIVRQYKTTFSMANSAALANWKDCRFDMVRAGLLLYGVSPFTETPAQTISLQPVMRFETRIIAVKHLPPGSSVGYGATWQSHTPRILAIAGAGYGDGYPREIGNKGHALVKGQPASVIGRVSMDTLALDITECGSVTVGEPVELWGEHLGVAKVAVWADTIAYELLCRVSARVPRLILN